MSATSHKLAAATEIPLLEIPFNTALEAMPEACLLANPQGGIAWCNQRAEALLGYSRSELIGKAVDALLLEPVPNARAGHTGGILSSLSYQAERTASELAVLRKDGSAFPAEICVSPMPTEAGVWMLATIRDITAWKRLEQQLHERSAALEAAHQEFHAFSHSISHDLRAPLRAIDGFALMLKKSLGENLGKQPEHALKRIQDNVAKMSRLIEDLLDFSTLAWIALTKKPLNPAALAQNVFNELAAFPEGRRVDFQIGALPACEADAALLRRVFANLFSNSLKFARDRNPAVIRVGCHAEKSGDVFFVQDNGVGFDMEYSDKLFQVFQRLHSPSEFEGTGMGLAIVRRIVQRHGGRVWAEAQVDRGATFYFTLGESAYGHSP